MYSKDSGFEFTQRFVRGPVLILDLLSSAPVVSFAMALPSRLPQMRDLRP